MFMVYIVTKGRSDERLSIDGIYIPKDRGDLLEEVCHMHLETTKTINGREYYVLWWD
ncbi:MAG: hypothetical protein QW738_06805 [Nitrososphaeria archaeon]